MEQSFFQKLRRVKLADLLSVFKLMIAVIPALIMKLWRKDLWLLCDSRYEAGDNAYHLFKYLREEQPQVDAVFALDKTSMQYEKVKALGKVVQYGSIKHWIYYLVADKNVSSQKMGKPNAAICYVLEVYGILKNKRAFLQHGIITADLTFLHYPHTKMKLFVTSTKDECEYVDKVYEYPKGAVQELGLCRFDALHKYDANPKQLLIMPTWRMYIRNEISGNEESLAAEFMNTDYYKFWNGLLEDKDFIDFIEEENIDVIFYPHREMKAFLHCFNFKSKNIKLLSYKECEVQTVLKESALLVTDYSSVSMDFAYMKKPLVYYQFDYEQFRSGHHPEGYFSFKDDGFGPVCETWEDVIRSVKNAFHKENGFVNEDKYLSRHERYFDLYDSDNCKRNYEAIAKM